jgi:type II secretory pathway component PulC
LQRVLAHYEGQTEEEAMVEDEEAMRPSETVMSVPHDLVPKVRELIAKRRVKGGRSRGAG